MTGGDTVSAYKGKDKKSAWESLASFWRCYWHICVHCESSFQTPSCKYIVISFGRLRDWPSACMTEPATSAMSMKQVKKYYAKITNHSEE